MKKPVILFSILVVIAINNNQAQTKLSAEVYAGYWGGSGEDKNPYIAVDKLGNVVIAGHTTSSNFPVTKDALQKTIHGAD